MAEQETMLPQSQAHQPALEAEMSPRPEDRPRYPGASKLTSKVALITGGDGSIGRGVRILFAREGAGVAIVYRDEDEDAQVTAEAVRDEGRECLVL